MASTLEYAMGDLKRKGDSRFSFKTIKDRMPEPSEEVSKNRVCISCISYISGVPRG